MRYLFCFLVCVPVLVIAQINHSVTDFYTDYGWAWNLDPTSSFSAKETDDHQLLLESNGMTPFSIVTNCILLDRKKEFQLETKFQLFRGNRFGFVLLTEQAPETYYVFSVYEKHVTYSKFEGDKEIQILFDIKNKKNYSVFEPIQLKVMKSRYKINFYLNNVLMLETSVVEKQSYCHGFMLEGSSKALLLNYKFDFSKDDLSNKNLIENPISGFHKENLGPNINSKSDEINPLISEDGKTLYFSKSNDLNNVGGKNDDVYFSHFNGRWEPNLPVANTLNDKFTNSVEGFFNAEKRIIVQGLYKNHINAGLGLSLSKKTEMSWSTPEGITIPGYTSDNIHVSNTISQNGEVIISSLSKNGQFDLFISFKKSELEYSSPVKINGEFNTMQNEINPFLTLDNKYLIFASDGLEGFGKFDIWMIKRLDETWQNWSEPQNLGPEINSPASETDFVFTPNSEYAYMVSDQKSFGGKDIIRIKIPEVLLIK